MDLLRRAAPTSGATLAERETAALRAAEIIAERGFVVVEGGGEASARQDDMPTPRSGDVRPHREPGVTPEGWVSMTNKSGPIPCDNCGRILMVNERILFHMRRGSTVCENTGRCRRTW